MRIELQRITESDYWVYGLRESDLDYTFRLAKGLVEAKYELYRQKEEKVREEQPELADDILDDITYYTYIEAQYVWHFCLWRLQAILEGIIVNQLLPSKPSGRLIGLKAKLNAVRNVGYTLKQDDYTELIRWGKLRNALSHAPPEQHRPGPLHEDDIVEYKSFIKRLCQQWFSEESRLCDKT